MIAAVRAPRRASAVGVRSCRYASRMNATKEQRSGHAVAVEILYASGCPHLREVRARLTAVAAEEGVGIALTETLLETAEQARQRRFPGSPTVRVEGGDVEPAAGMLELFGLG